VRSLGDFDGLDALGSWFLSQRPTLQVRGTLANKKNKKNEYIPINILKISNSQQ